MVLLLFAIVVERSFTCLASKQETKISNKWFFCFQLVGEGPGMGEGTFCQRRHCTKLATGSRKYMKRADLFRLRQQ